MKRHSCFENELCRLFIVHQYLSGTSIAARDFCQTGENLIPASLLERGDRMMRIDFFQNHLLAEESTSSKMTSSFFEPVAMGEKFR